MMKANELTPGDWLYYRGRFNAFPLRVEQVTRRKVGYHAEPHENRMYYLRLHEVEPIALTSETLEHNGFRKPAADDPASPQQKYVLAGDYEDIYAEEINDGMWRIDVYCTEFSLPRQTALVGHLHELQHWLRLCGISKELVF